MTIEDVTVIGVGSITLLCLFLFAQLVMNRVDVWAIVRRYVTVRLAENAPETIANEPLLPDETNYEIDETPQRVAEIRAESFTLGETTALARLVVAGKLGLTDAVKIGADAKSGEKYQRRSREIKAEVERLKEPQYPALTATRKPSVVER